MTQLLQISPMKCKDNRSSNLSASRPRIDSCNRAFGETLAFKYERGLIWL